MGDPVLTYVAPSDTPSQFCAVGSSKGAVYLQKLSDSLYMSEKFDKYEAFYIFPYFTVDLFVLVFEMLLLFCFHRPVLASCFERESRREKFIEQRFREIRLKKRDKE